jgi:hypothetical protein
MATSTLGSGTLVLAGTTSGTTTVTATAVAGTTTLTLPAATDTLVGKATTDTLTNKTLTGAAMNGTLGATTPSTASVTTLTTSSTVTHNGGTANGVPYLNGSKVLTTGSDLVFDGSNLGVGVTPSAWNSTIKAAQFALGGSISGATNTSNISLISNAFLNTAGSAYLYINSDYATRYLQQGGVHYWYNAASGTAGNTASFTQAMTLDASNNLLLGTTSSAGVNKGMKIIGGTSTSSSDYTFYSEFSNTTQSFGLRNDGNVVTTGNLLVGTTSNAGRLSVVGSGATGATYSCSIYNSAAALTLFQTRDDGFVFLPSTAGKTTGSSANLYIDSGNGAVYRSTSSLKYKTNVQDATHGLADLLQLRSVTYEGKAETDAGKTFGGFIAEEVHEAGLTEFVQYADDGSPDALSYGNMVSLCIKAIQEQQALITTLTARITALESA